MRIKVGVTLFLSKEEHDTLAKAVLILDKINEDPDRADLENAIYGCTGVIEDLSDNLSDLLMDDEEDEEG